MKLLSATALIPQLLWVQSRLTPTLCPFSTTTTLLSEKHGEPKAGASKAIDAALTV